jgi:hypothetical protein
LVVEELLLPPIEPLLLGELGVDGVLGEVGAFGAVVELPELELELPPTPGEEPPAAPVELEPDLLK